MGAEENITGSMIRKGFLKEVRFELRQEYEGEEMRVSHAEI